MCTGVRGSMSLHVAASPLCTCRESTSSRLTLMLTRSALKPCAYVTFGQKMTCSNGLDVRHVEARLRCNRLTRAGASLFCWLKMRIFVAPGSDVSVNHWLATSMLSDVCPPSRYQCRSARAASARLSQRPPRRAPCRPATNSGASGRLVSVGSGTPANPRRRRCDAAKDTAKEALVFWKEP